MTRGALLRCAGVLSLSVLGACARPPPSVWGPPTVSVVQPAAPLTVMAGQPFEGIASVTDEAEGALGGAQVVWTSSLEGLLATGIHPTLALHRPGRHLLTVSGMNSQGAIGSRSAALTVTDPRAPVVAVLAPLPGQAVARLTPITLTCLAVSSAGAALTPSAVHWSSRLSGELGSGAALETSLSIAGPDTLTCTALDPSEQLASSAAVDVLVDEGPRSSVQLMSPQSPEVWVKPGATGRYSPTVVFRATGRPTGPGSSPGALDAEIQWTVAGQAAGAGAVLLQTFTAPGDYQVAASLEADAQAQVTVHVVNNLPPACEIDNYSEEPARAWLGSTVALTGRCVDPETGTALVPAWSTSADPAGLGGGESLTATLRAPGSQLLRACATDPTEPMLVGCAARRIHVTENTPPSSCAILAPQPGAHLNAGVPVTFRGLAVDANDPRGDLSWRWTSGGDGTLAAGGTSFGMPTTPGYQTLTMAVTDPAGASCSASVNVFVNDGPDAGVVSVRAGTADCLNGSCGGGTAVTFTGTAGDPDGIAWVQWADSRDGPLDGGLTTTLPAPTLGRHTVVLEAADGQGARTRVKADFTVGTGPLLQSLQASARPVDLAVTAPGDIYFVDGTTPKVYRYLTGSGPQSYFRANDWGTALSILPTAPDPTFFVGTVASGVDRCVATVCTSYLGGPLTAAANAALSVAASVEPDLLAIGSTNGLVVTRQSDPALGAPSGALQGVRLLSGTQVRRIVIRAGSPTKIWAATDAGLAEVTVFTSAPFEPFSDVMRVIWHRPPEIPSGDVRAVALSPEGAVFYGTDSGAGELGGGFLALAHAPWRLADSSVHALSFEQQTVAGDLRNVLWAGTASAWLRVDVTAGIVTPFGVPEGVPPGDVRALLVQPDGTKLVGTSNGLSEYDGR